MQRHEFYTAISQADKFFNTSSAQVADRVLTIDEHQTLCNEAQAKVRGIFPAYAAELSIVPVRDPDEEFAGYTLSYEGKPSRTTTLEFDFGSEGIDVQ